MKKVIISVVLVLGLGMKIARAQKIEQAIESQPEQSIVGKILGDMKESTRIVHEINKENIAAEREAYRTMYAQFTKPDPDFVKFKNAKGLKSKMQVLSEIFKENCHENSEKEKEFREQIMSHETYKTLLEEQRKRREAVISGRYVW
jgi:hypothetical protein